MTDGTVTQTFAVSGMHCASCGLLIDDVVEELAGVSSSETDMGKVTTTVTFDPGATSIEDVVAAIAGEGYKAQPMEAS